MRRLTPPGTVGCNADEFLRTGARIVGRRRFDLSTDGASDGEFQARAVRGWRSSRFATRQLGFGAMVSFAQRARASHSRTLSCRRAHRAQGATMLLALDAHRHHPKPFTEEELRPYRQATAPESQKEAIRRRKVMRTARSTTKRGRLLKNLEERYAASSQR